MSTPQDGGTRGELRSTSFLIQRLTLNIQRGNVVAVTELIQLQGIGVKWLFSHFKEQLIYYLFIIIFLILLNFIVLYFFFYKIE